MFRLLGGVELQVGATYLSAGPPQRCGVLAALLIDAGRVVPVETLVARIWADDPPDKATRTLHTHLSRIRRLIESTGMPAAVVRVAAGYRIDVDPFEVDLHRFRALVSEAAGRDDAERAQRLRTALALWRGEPLAGLNGEWFESVRQAWRTRHLEAAVAWGEAVLRLGDTTEAITDLSALLVPYPLAEQLVVTLMRLLHAAGRDAEALAQYAAARRRLADELGVEPGPALRQLHRDLLRESSSPPVAPSVPAARIVPAQLPLDLARFTGRDAELATLTELAAKAAGTMVVAVVSGTAGVGKTTLAVHLAHRVAARFRDGQLYVNLRGFTPDATPVEPAEALRDLLHTLGGSGLRVPSDLSGRTTLYRSLLAGRRMLILLDNAREASQLRPLLPGAAGCLVLVTSRDQLLGLAATEDAALLRLDLPSGAEANRLLAARAGAARVAAEPAAAREIVAGCARLPLALAVIAARAAASPHLPLSRLAEELRDASRRIDPFTGSDPATDIRAVLDCSYRTLSGAAARMFRLLAVHPGPDTTVAAAAGLAGLTPAATGPLLTELTVANLLTEHRPGRFTFHDLLRGYADERLAEGGDDDAAALRRVLDHHLHTAYDAAYLLYPQRQRDDPAPPEPGSAPLRLADQTAAMRWYADEREVLLRCVDRAAAAGYHARVWQLANALVTYLHRAGYWESWAATQVTAVTAADRAGDAIAAARAHRHLARAYIQLNRLDDAVEHLREALRRFAAIGDEAGAAHAHMGLTMVFDRQDRHADALVHARAALEMYRSAGNVAGEANALNTLGWHEAELGDFDPALTHCTAALALLGRIGNPYAEADTRDSIAYIYFHRGELDVAMEFYSAALELRRRFGDRYETATTLVRIGDVQAAAGAAADSRTSWSEAWDLLTDLDHPDASAVRDRLERGRAPMAGIDTR
jgi:DNA-binding SARP family transcriptional activator/tetratricopeptide (TPR) repeat protein